MKFNGNDTKEDEREGVSIVWKAFSNLVIISPKSNSNSFACAGGMMIRAFTLAFGVLGMALTKSNTNSTGVKLIEDKLEYMPSAISSGSSMAISFCRTSLSGC